MNTKLLKNRTLITLFSLTASFAVFAAKSDVVNVSHWEREAALTKVRSADIELAISEVKDLNSLMALQHRSNLSRPVREAAVYQYARSLSALDRRDVPLDIIQHLSSYQARVVVPHEDHGSASVPLFNVRAAIAGVQNGWLRNESRAEAQLILVSSPGSLLDKYLQAGQHAQKSGYLDALTTASMAEALLVQTAAMEQLPQSPELTPLLAVTAAVTADLNAIRLLLMYGKGARLAAALDIAASQHPIESKAELLRYAIEEAPTENAALAIASWWPTLKSDNPTLQFVIGKLDDPQLGSSIALALARNPDTNTIKTLQQIAEGNSVAAKRARLSLSINRHGLNPEVQQ